jgi:hypothetical protein
MNFVASCQNTNRVSIHQAIKPPVVVGLESRHAAAIDQLVPAR